ncbi:MAG TPA: 2-oxoacid:acceptor oxidoreductase family protein [Solirubrobacterales bacterium]|jgi:pyruvate ferredoxin oxidoreductase gamma subunit
MFQVRIHGRGGQGVVTAAEMLSIAAFEDGKHAQAFPTFGSERTGAPVTSFCRIDERPIRVREPVAEPDALIIQDPTLLHQVKVFGGLREDGYVLINTSRGLDELGLGEFAAGFDPGRLLSVPASEIALEQLGRPLPNTALLGGFAAMTRIVRLQSVNRAISQKFSGEVADHNMLAADVAFRFVLRQIEMSHA